MKNDKTIIFDFDGTIANTLLALAEIYNRIAPKFHCKPINVKDADSLRNKRPQEFMRDYGVSAIKLPFLVLNARSELNKQINNIKPQTGICNALNRLKDLGYTIGIVTSNSKKNINLFLQKNDLVDVFDFVYTGTHVFGKHRKIKRILRDKKMPKNAVIYVGDETRDIEAAKKVGIAIIAVSWGFNKKEGLQRQDPDFIADEPEALIDIIQKHPT